MVLVQLMNDKFLPDTLADAPFWQRLDSIVAEARLRDIYIDMVPVWGSLVKGGMTTERAACYGHVLAKRYGNQPSHHPPSLSLLIIRMPHLLQPTDGSCP